MSEPTPNIRIALSGVAAWDDVVAERMRQAEAEGWSHEHDDKHDRGEMALAAACYATSAAMGSRGEASRERLWDHVQRWWPWAWTWWKPKDARRDLVRAGALILAEIERLDRKAPRPPCASCGLNTAADPGHAFGCPEASA